MSYEKFDNQIMANIEMGLPQFFQILANSTEDFPQTGAGSRMRAVDRRLQSLRKRGLISYKSIAGWSVNKGKS